MREQDQEERLRCYVAGLRGEPEPMGQGVEFGRGWDCGARERERGMKKPTAEVGFWCSVMDFLCKVS